MASGIACRPAWSLIDLHGVNILPKDQGQDSWWEQGRCEERSNDPLLLVVLKFMRQLWQILQRRFFFDRFPGVNELRLLFEGWRVGVSHYREDGHHVGCWRLFNLIYTTIICYCLCLLSIQHAKNRRCGQLSSTHRQCASSYFLQPKQPVAIIISQGHMQHVLDSYTEDFPTGHQLEDAPPIAKPQNLQMSLSSRSGDPDNEPNSTTITTADMFSDFLWLDQYSSPFSYPPIYAAGSSSAPATDPFPEQSLQAQLPAPILDQNLQDGDEDSINSVENPNTEKVPSTSAAQHNTGKAENTVYSCTMCPNVHFIGKMEFERHTDEQHRQSLLFPCHYPTCKRHENPFAGKENLIRHVKSQHPEDQPNSPQCVNKACDRHLVSSSATQKRYHDTGEDQRPLMDEYGTSEKEDQNRLKRQRMQEDTSEIGLPRLENDRLHGENDDLRRQLQNLKGKYDERGDLINRLLGRLK